MKRPIWPETGSLSSSPESGCRASALVRRLGPVAISLAVVTSMASCKSAEEEAPRLAENIAAHDAEVAAASHFDEVAAAVERSHIASEMIARSGVEHVVTEIQVPDEIKDAAKALTWDATCAVVTGHVPDNASSLADWLEKEAFDYGIEYFGAGAQNHANAIIASLQSGDAWSAAEDLCKDAGTILNQ